MRRAFAASPRPMTTRGHIDTPARRLWLRLLVLTAIAGLVAILAALFGDQLSLESLASQEAALLDLARRHTAAVVASLAFLYVGVTASSFPAATVLTFVSAWLFRRLLEPLPAYAAAVLLVSFAGTAGATIAFLLSRHLLRDALLVRYGDRAARFDEALRRNGSFYLLLLRLTPFVPFWLINLVMGLTPLRTRTFWFVSQVGMLPAVCIFVFAGQQVPSLADLRNGGVWDILWPEPFLALSLLAVFPLVVQRLAARWQTASAALELEPALLRERA